MPKRPDDSTLHAEQTLAAGWRFAHDEQVADQTTAWTPGEDALLNSDDTGRLPDCINWLKAGRCHGPAAADFDAGGWRKVRLPHDWTVEREPVREGEARNGFYRGGIGWYRRNLDLRHDPTRTVRLRFDGVFRDATVFLNGSLLAQNRGGYTDFECDLTPLLHADGDNQLVVRVDASGKEGWFYEGAGIYRDVTLIEAGTAQLVRGGLRVIPRPADDAVTKPVPVDVHAQCRNTTDTPINARVVHTLTDPDGKPIGAQTVDVTLPPGGTTDTHATFTVEQPQPWSVDQPKLYAVQTRLLVDDVTHDQVTTRTGLRTVRFDKDRGFFLNGEPMKLKGVCVHPDHAGVGSAVPAPLERWRLRRLKDMGTNAYRCSHNPPTATLLDACDELGMLVIDEVRCFGVSDEALLQLGRMVRRDRNHPSVILWSLGNEEMALQLTDVGRRIAERMRQVVRGLDTTRLVTVAVNDKWNTPTGVIEAEEVHGVNYLNLGSLEQLRANRPDLPVILSEEASALSTRGEYTNDPVAGVVAEYDVHDEFEGPHMSRWPFWGDTAESTWQTTVAHDYLGGIFVWTGFDYRGEQTPYVRWPSVGSHFGVMDMCGFDKDRTHYYRTWWKPDEPHVHVLPHWTWPGREGEPIDVWVYANATSVELRLNGETLGKQDMPANGHVAFKVPYSPGKLEAIAMFADGSTHTATRATTTAPAAVRLHADVDADIAVVRVEVVDAEGRVCPHADDALRFTLDGNARIIGLGNGDPNSHEPDKPRNDLARRRAFHGLAQVIVQADTRGHVTLQATADGLASATCELSFENS